MRKAKPTYYSEEKFNKHKEFLEKRAEMNTAQILEQEKKVWTRSAPADPYYQRDEEKPLTMRATEKLEGLCDRFEETCLAPARRAEAERGAPYQPPRITRLLKRCKGGGCQSGNCDDESSSSSSDSSSEDEEENQEEKKGEKSKMKSSKKSQKNKECKKKKKKKETARDEAIRWLKHRQSQPDRLDDELWDNRAGELNDGPACRCSVKARKIGIRHGVYQGEEDRVVKTEALDPSTNNSDRLFHYRVTISPPTNFLVKNPTVIQHDGHDFVFEVSIVTSVFSPVFVC